MTPKSRPGPMGTSCLTCKRRHKKCDQRQPVCKVCEDGQFECLGYGHNRRDPILASRSVGSYRLIAPKNGDSSSHSTFLGHKGVREASEDHSFPEDIRPIPPPHKLLISTNSNEGRGNLDSAFDKGSTSALVSTQTRKVEDYLYLFATRPVFKTMESPISILRKIIDLQTQPSYFPLDPLKSFLNSHWFIEYILAQSDKMTDYWYFKSTNCQQINFLEDSVHRLQTSTLNRWIALVVVGIAQSFLTGDASQRSQNSYWIGYIENFAKRELTRDLVPREMQERRSDWVHISLMKTMTLQSSGIYQVLRSLTPTFLQAVYSDPQLWLYACNPTCIPLSNILASEVHELAFFALMDCTCAMAFGLPQQVEYDTTIYSLPTHCPSHQWAHSIPANFLLLLADINACRDKSLHAREWREIERSLQTWHFRSNEHTFTESWMTIAWYAVQESWRLALLAYLYMAVCDTPSNDPRVQSCIKQILQVVGIVRERGPSSAHVSFFVQYLIVGICARSEAHRKVVRDKISTHNVTRFWIMRALDFVPALDHLWHGAAAGGRPIKWSDYMRSREEVLPIVI
ncbi:hypothetical protein ACGC1H_005976 [Rhizoctonia solani]|uniref:Zn(2)-C6 fungal-type domain-containing protein n=1 Tax=Rhizoctonia solani TaxID=456999 RepID=A0A8H3BL71_9AGAM|nr:unnamed protein product [Rhizoctonia solani]